MSRKHRYVQVGIGGRGEMYLNALQETYRDTAELAGICDRNWGRLQMRQAEARERGIDLAVYRETDFDRMIAECKPDTVIVTSMDSTHDDYICRAMELGCDVITEKPMTIDAARCQRIVDTQKRTGRQCTVTFNCRYAPHRTQIKDLLMSGLIGEILSVDFHWLLDTSHGADYFRRWHRNKENSGGLLVHKATHHFDLMNWWLSAVPTSVYATGKRAYYTPQTAERFGLSNRGERCLDCAEAGRCPFAMDMSASKGLTRLYLDHEGHDGYQRDRCIFSDKIDIEDTMNLTVTYDTGVMMSYSLYAYMPWEGYIISLNGSKGRIEVKCQDGGHVFGDGSVPGQLMPDGTTIKVYPHFAPAYAVEVWQGTGSHGGGDTLLLDDLFSPTPQPDPYMRVADQRAGAYSILTGIAANESIAVGGKRIDIEDLVKGLERPDFPAMPTGDEPLGMPEPVGV